MAEDVADRAWPPLRNDRRKSVSRSGVRQSRCQGNSHLRGAGGGGGCRFRGLGPSDDIL